MSHGATIGMLALLFGAIVVCTALVGLVCFNWDRLRQHLKRSENKKSQLWAMPAPVSFHQGVEQCPQPKVEAVSFTSRSTKGSLQMPSVKEAPQKDTRSLLKLPHSELNSISSMSTCSGSGTSSINSQSLARPNGVLSDPRVQDSKRKISKVQPI